jgi:hypothetical protein
MSNQIERICDMRGGFKLRLLKQEDGDICVSILKESYRVNFDDVEFCNSGTQSPRTHKALCNLFNAMQEDENDRPHNLVKVGV